MSVLPTVDIHCHLLPDWDDGPQKLDESLRMAARAAESGIQSVVTTPHVGRELGNKPERPAHEIAEATARLQQEIQNAGIDLKVVAGAELMLKVNLADRIAAEPWLSVGGRGRHALVELPPFGPWTDNVDQMLFEIALQGVTPILAHPERYSDVQRDWSLAANVAKRGVLLQITADSLIGADRTTGLISRRLLQEGCVSFVASDAHSVNGVLPGEVADTVLSIAGEENARQILEENPRRLLAGEAVQPISMPISEPQPLRRKKFWFWSVHNWC